MFKISRISLVCCLCLSLAGQLFGQSSTLKKANQYFENEAYPAAARLYTQSLRNGYDQEAAERLAKCYQNVGDCAHAAEWYAKAIDKTIKASVAYDYGQVLKCQGEYQKAAAMFDKYGELSSNFEEARKQAEGCERAEAIKGDGKGWKVSPTDLNSKSSDFGAVMIGGKMYFVSARNRGFFTRILNLRNDNYFYDIYAADPKSHLSFNKAKLQRGALKTRYHDGPIAVGKDVNVIYITRSNIKKGHLKRGENERAHLQLYSADLQGSKYMGAKLLPFNADNHSSGHAAVSADGHTIIFASDAPGGLGGSDLYMTQLQGNAWSAPRNLGGSINTPGDELFPSLSASGLLVFASSGHPGLGGLDLFLANPLTDGLWGNVKNLGAPLNSPRDDFALTWDRGGKGYFASNREGGKGDDDIYHFSRVIPLRVLVTNSLTGEPVSEAQAVLRSANGSETQLTTDAKGIATTYIEWNQSYKAMVAKEGYIEESEMLEFDAEKSIAGRELHVELYKFPVAIVDGSALSSAGAPLEGVQARVVGETKEIPFAGDAQGKFGGQVDTSAIYTAIVQKPGYMPEFADFSTEGAVGDLVVPVNVRLTPGGYLLVEGTTVDKSTGQRLGSTAIRAITDRDSIVRGPQRSRRDGRFWMGLNRSVDADLLASREGYFTARADLPSLRALQRDSTAQVTLELVPAKVGEIVKIIYYGYREATLTQQAKNSLDEIVFFLLDNPGAIVELSAHTDARGSDAFNLQLSEERAKAAVDYVVSKGVGKGRITAKGYGRSQLANDCVEGKECTDEQHGLNRRCEIKVTAIK